MRRKSMAACTALALVASFVAAPAVADATPSAGGGAGMARPAPTPVPAEVAVGETAAAASSSRNEFDHDTRNALYDVVAANPGVHLARAASLADVSLSTARYHVRVLEREDAVDSENRFGKRRLYPAGSEDDRARAAAASDPTLSPVLQAVAVGDPATVSTVATSVDRADSTVSHHLGRLADAGVVDRERVDGNVVFSLGGDAT